MKKILSIFAISISLVLLMASCQKYPQAEVDKTIAMVDSAKIVKADLYVPEQFGALQDSFNVAIADIELANSKTFKSFKSEVVKLNEVSVLAEQVIKNTANRIEEIKTTVSIGLISLKESNDANKVLLRLAPKGKDGKAALDAIDFQIHETDVCINTIQSHLDSGNYLEAEKCYKEEVVKVDSIKTELTAAIEKVKK